MKVKKEVRVKVTRNTARVRITMTAQEHQRVTHFFYVLIAVAAGTNQPKKQPEKKVLLRSAKARSNAGLLVYSVLRLVII